MPPRAADPSRWLTPPQGLERDEQHTYWLAGYAFPATITGVLAALKSAQALARIEASRAVWEPRGLAVHSALELAATEAQWSPDHCPPCWPYLDWIEPLLAYPIWEGVEVIAAEFPLYWLEGEGDFGLAGTFDLAWEQPGTVSPLHGGPLRTLVDLKTQASPRAAPYDTRPQLGGYLSLAAHHGLVFDAAATLWARPGHCRLSSHGVEECLTAWQQALDAYLTVSSVDFLPAVNGGDSQLRN